MANLEIAVIIYADPSLHTEECHAALVVGQDTHHFYIYHAVEDSDTDTEMKFERAFKSKDPLTTNRRHQVIPVQGAIAKADFDKLDKALKSTQVPRPREGGWNCQNWVEKALESLEKEGLMKGVEHPVSFFGTIFPCLCSDLSRPACPGSFQSSCDLNWMLRKFC